MNFDQAFIKRIVQQDEFAFAEFYQATVDDFFRYVASHYTLSEPEIHDIISDVYLKIREGLDKYDEKYQFGQFVRSILKNHCKDYFKKQKPLLLSDLTYEYEDISGISFEEESEYGELFRLSVDNTVLQQAISSLDRDMQEVLHARFVLGYGYDVLSDMFSMKSDALRKQISRILKKLHTQLAHTREA